MFVKPLDGEWRMDAVAIAPIRLARFTAGFVGVLAAMAMVGAMLYLAVFALAGAVSSGEMVALEAMPLTVDAVGAPGTGR